MGLLVRRVSGSTSYTTSFAATENPISESGAWTHNPNNSWQKLETTGGNAIAAAYTELFDDAYAYLANWSGNDYEITATVMYTGTDQHGEVELLLRVTDTDTTVTAYEFLYNTGGSWLLVRWNGALGNYTEIHAGGSTAGSGDNVQIRARIVGTFISLYWRQTSGDNWTTLLSNFEDPGTPLSTGKPGMAVYVHAANNNRLVVGLRDYSIVGL